VHPRRTRIALIVVLLAGLAILGLSFVPAWLVHDRIVLGEGFRRVHVELSAWTSQSWPVLSAAVLLATLGSALAVARLVRMPHPGSGWVLVAACAGLGLAAAGAVPVSQSGHASSVMLTADWGLLVAIALAGAGVVGAAVAAAPTRLVAAACAALVVIIVVGGWGGRVVELNLTEGTGRHYSEGSYTRPATGDQPAETLTFGATTITVGVRWSGQYEGSGRVVSISDDPACPDVRGSYHVDAAAGGGITWEMIVDTCANGARARDLTTGVWKPRG
jgi:hypothetical protein